jgi:hypothetical protein
MLVKRDSLGLLPPDVKSFGKTISQTSSVSAPAPAPAPLPAVAPAPSLGVGPGGVDAARLSTGGAGLVVGPIAATPRSSFSAGPTIMPSSGPGLGGAGYGGYGNVNAQMNVPRRIPNVHQINIGQRI